MKTPKLVAVVGTKRSGKTTVAECLISGLSNKGFRVGSIKHIHHPDFTMDTEGTNTWKHARAGSRIVAAISKREIAIILKDDPDQKVESILDFMARQEIDIVVVEGLHSSIGQRTDVAKIVTAHDTEDLQERLSATVPPVIAVSGLVAVKASGLRNLVAPMVNAKTECPRLVETVEKEVFRIS